MDKRIFFLCALLLAPAALSQDDDPMKAWNDYIENYAKPGPEHSKLDALAGVWDVSIRVPSFGREDKAKATSAWRIDGRWMATDIEGTLMGRPYKALWLLGYDRFARKFVACSIDTGNTAMIQTRGDFGQDGRSLVLYGEMNEPMTGEVGKAIKVAYRIQGPDEHVVEIHDLAIGEDPEASKVIEFVFERRK